MVAKKQVVLHPLVKTLFDELKKRKVSVPDFSDGIDIPKDRIYKWKQQGTAPKDDDANKIREWLKLDIYPPIKGKDELKNVIGSIEERLLHIEAHLEVFENAIAGLLSDSKKEDFFKTVDGLRATVQAV